MARWIAHELHRRSDAPADDSITLDYEGRFLRRRLLETDAGAGLMVDLPETVSLEEGDALIATDGTRIAVLAAREPLMEVTGAPEVLARLAWHIGNRHTPAEIGEGRIRIRADGVLADMLSRLGVRPRAVIAPFAPEGGAYGTGRTHGHDHGHDHGGASGGHHHHRGHSHEPGAGCGCGHDHG